MVKAAAERGWIDGPAVALEQIGAIKRAGADFILTYFAASWPSSSTVADTNADWFARAAASSPAASTRRSARSPRSAAPRSPSCAARALRLRRGGDRYIDFVQSYGASLLGHAHQRWSTSSRGRPPRDHVRCADPGRRCSPRPSAPGAGLRPVRLVSSGTEGAMSALRVARGYTGRDRVVKFSGCYHGHSDACSPGAARAWRRSACRLGRRASRCGRRHRGRALQRGAELDDKVRPSWWRRPRPT